MSIDEILEIENEAFSDPWTKDFYKKLQLDKNCYFIKLENHKKIIAYAIILDTTEVCELIKIAVSKEYRRKKYGLELMDLVFQKTKELNREKIFLEVREKNIKAQNLYLKTGFIELSRRKKYYKDTGEDALIMLKKV